MITASSAFLTANASLNKTPVFLVGINGYTRVFLNRPSGIGGQYDWIVSLDKLGVTINDLDGGANLSGLAFTVQDRGQAVTGDFPGFVFEGKVVTLKTGFGGMSQADFVTLFTGIIDHVDSANGNNDYYFNCVDNKDALNQVIYTVADDGFPTDNDHRKTLNQHPLDILTDILTAAGVTYNSTKIAAYRDGIFSGTQFEFSIDSPPVALDFIQQQIMKPLGGYIWTNNVGAIDVNFIYPLSTTSVFSLNEDSIVGIPEASQSDLINTTSVRMDKDTDGKFQAELVENYTASISRFGQYKQQVIESDGLRSGLQGFFLAALTSQMIFRRYGMKNLRFETLNVFWNAAVLEPGDLISVTHSKVPDRATGVMGITGKLFVVMDRAYDFFNCTVQLLLLDASYLTNFGLFKIAPDGEADYAAASAPDKAKYMFLCDNDDDYSNEDAAHILG